MKLTAVSGTFPATILDSYDSYHVVPSTATKVATRTSSIDLSEDSKIKTTYAVSISPSQAKGDYTGKVKYTVVHPNMANADGTISYLYDAVAAMSKGTQTIEELQEHIIQPTANDTISSNSGVYEYNASLLGASSDASNTSKIYYYRGILDSYKSDYIGSSGMADAFPNYVKLGITCWRIIRTTGSGGIKMVYNGIYSNTTNGSCANAQAAAAIRTTSTAMADNTETFVSSFTNKDINEYGSIVGVGYTRDNTYASSSVTTATEYGAIFGTNLSYSNNSTNSIIKNDIETWFTNNLIQYESKLEPSAGFCNDRTINIGNEWEIPMTDEMLIDHPRSVYNDNADYYFGAYIRNKSEIKKPSLACPRNNADLYTAPSATNGNKQLNKPVALLTVDEMNLAGARAETGDWYLKKMYLNSGSDFWLLSPSNRSLNGNSYGFYYSGSSAIYLDNAGTVALEYGVRPVISLKPGTVITGGSGTATDPWMVQ